MLGTSPAILACLRCFITVLNIILGVSSLSAQLRGKMMLNLQVYALLIFLFSLVFFLWMDYYLAFASDVSFTIITFLLSISGSIFCFSCLACCCLVRNNSPKVLSYMVTTTTMSVPTSAV